MNIKYKMTQFTDINDPILDLEGSPMKDESVEHIEWYEYQPQSANARQNVEIWVNNTDQYTLPCEAYLQISGQLTKADDTNYNENDQVALVNNGIMALFDTARYTINGQEIEALNNNMDIATTILGLVSYSDDYAKTAGTSMFWAKDTSTRPAFYKFNQGNVRNAAGDGQTRALVNTNDNYNHGFAIRHGLLFGDGNDGFFDAIIPLSHIFGFCRDVRKVLYGVKHTLYLQRRGTDVEAIYRNQHADDGKVTLSKLSLWMPTVTPSLEWRAKLEGWMNSRAIMTAYYQAHQVDQLADQNNVTDLTWKLAVRSGSERPRHIFIAFQNTNKRNSQQANAMIFDNFSLTDIHVLLNNERFPLSDLSLNFNQRRYMRAYKMLLEFMGRDQNVDTGLQISSEDFRTLYPIYHFDLEKQSDRLKSSISDIYIRSRFSALPGNYRGYAFVMSDRILKIESDGSKMNIIF